MTNGLDGHGMMTHTRNTTLLELSSVSVAVVRLVVSLATGRRLAVVFLIFIIVGALSRRNFRFNF
jgi:hypothetical protein